MKRTPMPPRQSGLKRKDFKASKHWMQTGGYAAGDTPAEDLAPPPRKPRRKSISPASPAQREKARLEGCVVTGTDAAWAKANGGAVDPAHLAPRGRGGCDDPLCVVPLARQIHRAFDDGNFDLLPYLVGKRVPELQHALGHYEGNLLALLQRLTGARYSPEEGTE